MDTFGREIVGEDGFINRRKLGSIVFSNAGREVHCTTLCRRDEKTHRHRVASNSRNVFGGNSTVGTRKIGIKTRTDAPIVVVEAAILLEAGWYQDMGEVPTLFVTSFPDLGDRV